MKVKLAEYYTAYPQDKTDKNSDSHDYHSNIPNYEERCKKIREKYMRTVI